MRANQLLELLCIRRQCRLCEIGVIDRERVIAEPSEGTGRAGAPSTRGRERVFADASAATGRGGVLVADVGGDAPPTMGRSLLPRRSSPRAADEGSARARVA